MRALFAGLAMLPFTGVFAQTAPLTPDIPGKFQEATQDADYVKREVMIPMRDGVKLHTVIVIPKGAHGAPIILTRTPYDASKRTARFDSPHMLATLAQGDEVFVEEGYIRVFQDVRGKYGSEGDYVMHRPLRGPLNDSAVDYSTDAWDTIDWLVKNVPESNGKVGMVGSSYEGFTVLMALVHPHPALKAAVPMSPMVDGWKGDDWFHNGAFRQSNFDYFHAQTTQKGRGGAVPRGYYDDYTAFLEAGSGGGYARQSGMDQLPFWKKVSEHPAYDFYWQRQALDTVLAAQPLKVPTLFVASLWDQEDMYGAIAAYEAVEPRDTNNDTNFLALGPWRHSGVNYEGRGLGPLKFDGDTALQFRRDVMQPFLDEHLKDGAPKANTPPVFAYETGSDVWRRLKAWPLSCETGCAAKPKKLYLEPAFGLGFDAPGKAHAAYDEYVSDPAKPVPYQPRPVSFADGDAWKRWLLVDQRFVDGRPDVLTYVSAPLTAALRIGGAPRVDLYASTSGTDSDWVVKLIDVYPDEVPSQPELGGYELNVGMDIFRGRYRESLEHPAAIPAGKVQRYHFALPNANHVFLPGHRLMVQVQSSWFPLYDRNPQTYVPNIFFAAPPDYRKATQRVYHAGTQASSIELPVVPSTEFSLAASAYAAEPVPALVAAENLDTVLQTVAERSDYRKTGRYDEVERLCRGYERIWPQQVRCFEFGRSPEGRPMLAMAVSRSGALSGEEAARRGIPVLLLQAGIHAGEIDGKDAGFLALREMLERRVLPDVLDHSVIVFVPVFNLDGHERFGRWNRPNQVGPEEMGWRTTAQNFNLNRDYMKADALEMQAMLRLLDTWDPVIYTDLHATDGANFQHDVSITVEPLYAGDGALREAARALQKGVTDRLTAAGSLPLDFYPSFVREDDPASGFEVSVAPPRLSTGYWGLRNRLSMLVETHSWKDYPTRVHITHNAILALAELTATRGAAWLKREHEADRRAAGLGGTVVPLTFAAGNHVRMIDFKGYAYSREPSAISGRLMTRYDTTKPEIWHLPLRDTVKATLTVRVPQAGYIVPAAYAEEISHRLALHDISFRKLDAAAPKLAVETFRATEVMFNKPPFEGRTSPVLKGEWKSEIRDVPAGSLFVPIDQPAARLLVALLEPLSADSFAAQGLFNGALEQKEYMEPYVAELVAERILASDPRAAAEFRHKLDTDEAFARDPQARLDFFYRRSPSWDDRLNLYPVYRLEQAPPAGSP